MSEQDNLEQIDYNFPKLGKSKWITISFALFLFGLISYFPFMYKIKSTVKSQLNSIPGCSVDYEDIKLEFFFPKVIVKKLIIPQSCFGKYGDPLKMESVYLYFRGLNFSPFGPHFKLETNLFGQELSSYITAGFGGIAINIRENTIDLAKLKKLIPKFNLAGKVKIDAMVKFSQRKLKELKLNIRSNDFTLPGQSIQGFKLSTMGLNNLLLKANLEANGKKLKIENLILGDQDAAIRANFTGSINLNHLNMSASKLNIKGEVAFSSKFLEDYSIIKLVMNKFDKKDEFYQIKLTGPISSPKPSSAR